MSDLVHALHHRRYLSLTVDEAAVLVPPGSTGHHRRHRLSGPDAADGVGEDPETNWRPLRFCRWLPSPLGMGM